MLIDEDRFKKASKEEQKEMLLGMDKDDRDLYLFSGMIQAFEELDKLADAMRFFGLHKIGENMETYKNKDFELIFDMNKGVELRFSKSISKHMRAHWVIDKAMSKHAKEGFV